MNLSDPNDWNKRVVEAKGDEMALVMNSTAAFTQSRVIGEQLIKIFAKPGMKVLDVGCGYGRFYPAFRSAGVEYTGVDFSEKMIEEAKRRNPDGNFELHDMMKWFEYKYKGYDLVFECICLSSFNRLDMKSFKEMLLDHASETGKVIMVEPDETIIAANKTLWE